MDFSPTPHMGVVACRLGEEMDEAREQVAVLDDHPARTAESHGASTWKRVAVLSALVIVLLSGLVIFVAWRSLTAIERVPFDGTEARQRLEAVSDEQVQQFQAALEAAETAALEGELAAESLPVDDQDLLDGPRSALAGREISANFEVPHAHSSPVDDSVYDAYLLIGADLSGSLADVIMYVLKPTDGGSPIIASLPRDLYLPNPCTRTNTRLNAALNGCGEFANGPELLGLMVEDFTGIPVDHFAIVDFEGFVEVVDAFGGYEICVDNPVRDPKAFLNLDAGCSLADGETVLAWVRSRRTQEFVNGRWRTMEGVSDFSRQERQQEVLLGIASKLRSFSSITAFRAVVSKIQDSVQVDEGLDFATLINTAWGNRDLDLTAIERLTLDFDDRTVEVGGLTAYVLVPTMPFEQALAGTTVALDDAGGA